MFFFDLINWNIGIKKGNQIISRKKDCWYRFREKDYMVHKISRIIKKYETYQSLQIKYVYE